MAEEGGAVAAVIARVGPDKDAEASGTGENMLAGPMTSHQRAVGSLNDLCLFVANLPSSFTDEELEHHLRSLLSRFGTIHSTKAARDKKLRPFCFVQFKGVVQPEVFTQPHYLGGRSLRLEKSRVRSNDLTTAVAMAAARSTPSPVPIEVSTPSKWHFAPYGPPPLIFYTLFVGGFSPEEGTRKALFHRFKRYGYVLGVELQWLQGYTKIAYIYYESGEAVQAAIRENNDVEALGGVLKCEAVGQPDHEQGAFSIYAPYPAVAATAAAYYAGANWYGAAAAAGGVPGMMGPVHPSSPISGPFIINPSAHPQQQGNHSFGHRF